MFAIIRAIINLSIQEYGIRKKNACSHLIGFGSFSLNSDFGFFNFCNIAENTLKHKMFWLKARKLGICKGLSIEKCNVTKVTPFLGLVVHVLFYLVSLLYCKVTY